MSTVDRTTLARLHAALDSVDEAGGRISEITAAATPSQPGIERVAALVSEAREVLRSLVARR